MRLQGQEFTNSETCRGVAFTTDAPLDLAEITIAGRYPEAGWAKNRESHEMVQVLRGAGQLVLRSGETTELTAGDVVHVPPETWFSWSGDMTILMACSPAFNVEQYEIEEQK